MSAKRTNYVHGAAILGATMIIVKLIGGLFKIPLYAILDDDATSYFNVAYNVYSLLLTIATAGVPVAIARLISESVSVGRINQSRRIYSVAMPAFGIIGAVCAIFMMAFCRPIAEFMEAPDSAASIFILGPAVFFCCIIAVYRGYSQGHEDMVPTSISQIIEVGSKLVFGLAFSFLFLKLGFSASYTSAGAISGSVIGLAICIPVLAYYRRKSIRENSYELISTDTSVLSRKSTLKEIFRISIPMTLSSALLNIITLFDTKIVRYQLANSLSLSLQEVNAEYSAFSRAHTVFTLPSSLIVAISVSIVPAIAAAIALKKYKESAEITSSALKLMNLFALPAGMGMCVLATPIYRVLFGDNPSGPICLAIMGIASYFVCFQLVSTALVQASGLERVPLISMFVGSGLKMVINWVLVGSVHFGIAGAPISTLFCYLVISLINMIGLLRKAPVKPKLGPAFIKPLICTAVMGAVTWGVYGLLSLVGGGFFTSGRLPMAVALAISIIVAVAVYFVLIIVTGALTKEDAKLMPKGEKIAKLLKLK